MKHRPLIAVFISLASGIIFLGRLPLNRGHMLLAVASALALTTVVILFLRPRKTLIYIAVFLTGGLLELYSQKNPAIKPYAEQRALVRLEARVLEPIETVRGASRFAARATRLMFGETALEVSEKIKVTVYDNCPPLMPGERILFKARLRPFTNFKNPGAFDYERSMEVQGFACLASVSDGRQVLPLPMGTLGPVEALSEHLKRPIREFLSNSMRGERLSLLSALLLGERQSLTAALREQFARTGLSHVLAISGLHVGMTAWAAFMIVRWLMLRSYRVALAVDVQKWAALLSFFPALLYSLLAGFHVSTQRALIMLGVFLLSVLAGRAREVWSTLSIAGIIILAADPASLFSISFQLSFSAVAGILLLAPLIMKPLGKRELPKPALYLAGILSATTSATLFLLPITSHYFNQLSLVAIPANLIVVPLLGIWVLPLGLISCLLLSILPGLSYYVLSVSALGVDLMLAAIQYLSSLEWASIWVATPNFIEMAVFLAAAALTPKALRSEKARRALAFLLCIIALDNAYWLYKVNFNGSLSVTYLDVAQGNAAILDMPGGKRMLIDGGGFGRDTFDVGRFVVAPFLWSKKIRHIDYIVLSHPQADHMNGLKFIAKAFSVKEFWHSGAEADSDTFRELMEILKEKRIMERRIPEHGERFTVGEVFFECLHPPPDAPLPKASDKKAELNNLSMVLKVVFRGRSFLFPGDVEASAEKDIISRKGVVLSSNVLLAPHHGSRSSCTEAFLAHVRPKICIISSGRQSSFGFPHREAIQRIIGSGATILRTDTEGAIEVTVLKDGLMVRCFSGREVFVNGGY